MDPVTKDRIPLSKVCGLCNGFGIGKCARCCAVYYCCKEHQHEHWPTHKKTCKKAVPSSNSVSKKINQPVACSMRLPTADNKDHNWNEASTSGASSSSTDNRSNINKSYESAQFNNPNNFSIVENTCINLNKLPISLENACIKFIKHINTLGVCIFDNFLGSGIGKQVLKEVENCYNLGLFEKEKFIKTLPSDIQESVRSDVTMLLKGTEPEYTYIAHLITKISSLIVISREYPNNGLLSRYKLEKRTKVMAACYPGNGTFYKKHVDNSREDGRCITVVYYLNCDWDKKKHGGVLRLYPTGSLPFDIEPIFDRLLLFWSDKRTPHEVLPTFKKRFALTTWIFDVDERDRYLKATKKT